MFYQNCDRQTDRHTDIQTYKQTDRQTLKIYFFSVSLYVLFIWAKYMSVLVCLSVCLSVCLPFSRSPGGNCLPKYDLSGSLAAMAANILEP